MKSATCMYIGAGMGALWGVVLWLSMDALSTASFILEGNPTSLPLKATAIIMSVGMVTLLTSGWWVPVIKKQMELIVESVQHERGVL